jgi:hypothetical protein
MFRTPANERLVNHLHNLYMAQIALDKEYGTGPPLPFQMDQPYAPRLEQLPDKIAIERPLEGSGKRRRMAKELENALNPIYRGPIQTSLDELNRYNEIQRMTDEMVNNKIQQSEQLANEFIQEAQQQQIDEEMMEMPMLQKAQAIQQQAPLPRGGRKKSGGVRKYVKGSNKKLEGGAIAPINTETQKSAPNNFKGGKRKRTAKEKVVKEKKGGRKQMTAEEKKAWGAKMKLAREAKKNKK